MALALDAENATLKANLHWIPDPAPSYVTARVVADAGGVYARSVLLSVGPNHGITKGQIALDDRGLVGRVTEVGARSARVLLITDMNSRIPVTLEGSRARAMLVGTNGNRPRLMYWPEGVTPAEGERVVTSAEANAFPADLPVGTVHYTASNVAEVEPAARLDRLEVVRLFDYGLHGILPPEATSRPGDKGERVDRARCRPRRSTTIAATTDDVVARAAPAWLTAIPGIRPRPSLWRHLDAAARLCFPMAITGVAADIAGGTARPAGRGRTAIGGGPVLRVLLVAVSARLR